MTTKGKSMVHSGSFKKGHKSLWTPKTKEKVRKWMLENNPFKGKKHTEESRMKMRIARKNQGSNVWNKGLKIPKSILEKGYGNWKGGITPLVRKIRNCSEYSKWRLHVFTRDKFTCQNCGVNNCWIEAHHKKAFAIIMLENKIKTFEESLDCKELWQVSNGITFCKKCHSILDDWKSNSKRNKINGRFIKIS